MSNAGTGPGGILYDLDSTTHACLPVDEKDHLKALQNMCGGFIEMFFSPDGKHCFYGHEEGRYVKKRNMNPDLMKLLGPGCELYGAIFKLDKMPTF